MIEGYKAHAYVSCRGNVTSPAAYIVSGVTNYTHGMGFVISLALLVRMGELSARMRMCVGTPSVVGQRMAVVPVPPWLEQGMIQHACARHAEYA